MLAIAITIGGAKKIPCVTSPNAKEASFDIPYRPNTTVVANSNGPRPDGKPGSKDPTILITRIITYS